MKSRAVAVAAAISAELGAIKPRTRGAPALRAALEARRAAVLTVLARCEARERGLGPWAYRTQRSPERTAERAARIARLVSEVQARAWARAAYEVLTPSRAADELRAIAPRHPALAAVREADRVVSAATTAGVLPEPCQEWDDRGRGEGVSVDLYAHVAGLVLVQVRRVERRYRKGFLRMSKEYLVTDGRESVTVPSACIKRSADADPSADSPLRKVRHLLPSEWQARIDGPPPKLRGTRLEERVGYKVVERREDGALVSVYDRETVYSLGRWLCQAAKPEHRGGFYFYASEREAIEACAAGTVFNTAWTEGRELVLVRCSVKGTVQRYANGKLAGTYLRADEVLRPVAHAEAA